MPSGLSVEEAAQLRKADPQRYAGLAAQSIAKHVQAMLAFQKKGAEVFDYGNNIRQRAFDAGVKNAFDFPGFVAYIRPLFCEGKGPSAGWHFPVTRRISTARMKLLQSFSPKMSICAALAAHGARESALPRLTRAHLLAGIW